MTEQNRQEFYERVIFLDWQNCAKPYSLIVEEDSIKGQRAIMFDKEKGGIVYEYWN